MTNKRQLILWIKSTAGFIRRRQPKITQKPQQVTHTRTLTHTHTDNSCVIANTSLGKCRIKAAATLH